MPSCFVSTCKSSEKSKIPGLSFHRFPAKLRSEWLLALGLPPDMKIRNSSVICSQHFLDSDYLNLTRYKFLKENVIPSVNLPTKKFIFSEKNLNSMSVDNVSTASSSSCIESQSTNLPGQSFTINDSSSYSPQEIRTINMIVSNLHSYCSRFRNATTKTTADQYKIYLTALESDPVFNAMENNTIDHLDGESDFIKKWMELAEKLNSVNGPKRTWAHWKQKFAEWKFSTRSKYLEMIKGLSIIEAKALYLWGSPEGSNLLLVNSEVSDLKETPEESASTPADDETSFHCFLSAKNLETGRTLNISCERLSNSPILNSDLLDNNYLKIEPIEMDCEDYTELNIKSEDNNYTELNIKTEDNATIDDDDSEMNSLVDVKTENLSDSDMEDVTDADGNISPESTPYLLNSTPSCSNSESLKSEKKWQTKKDALKSTSKKSTIKKMKTKKGKVFYVQIEKIS